jgi:hypothetical protein
MKHELKIWPQYYCRVADGSKTFEVRKNDRGFQPGDTVFLREYDPDKVAGYDNGMQNVSATGDYTGSPNLKFTVGYVLPIDAERVVFSLLQLTPPRGDET